MRMLRWLAVALCCLSVAQAQIISDEGFFGGSAAPGVPSWTFVGSAAQGGGGSSETFTNITVPAGLLVVVVTEQSSPTIAATAVSFGATSLTKAIDDSQLIYSNNASIWYGTISAGTQSIVVTVGSSTIQRSSISYGIMTGVTAAPTAVQTSEATSTTQGVTIVVPATGIAITGFNYDRSVTGSYTHTTEDNSLTLSASSGFLSIGHTTATGSLAISFTGTISIASVVSAAWGP